MSKYHVVKIAPLHTSILLTLVYCLVASTVLTVIALFSFAVGNHNESIIAMLSSNLGSLLEAVLLNIALVFVLCLLASTFYNFLAKNLGGIEITLDKDDIHK